MYPGGNVIRVTPTMLLAAYADGDAGITAEIPNAVSNRGGVSELVGVSMVCGDAGQNPLGEILFHSNNQSLGDTGTDQATLTDAQALAMGFLGLVNVVTSDVHAITSTADSSSLFISVGSAADDPAYRHILLQAAAGSRSVYFTHQPNVAWDYESATEVQYIFHVKYLD